MYLSYSALENGARLQPHEPAGPTNERLLRYLAYLAACSKMHREIVAIQRYIPGWKPQFR